MRTPRKFGLIGLGLLCLANLSEAANPGPRYVGRVLYRGTRAPVAGVLVEVVEAEDDGKPKEDDVLGSARADASGRFMVVLEKTTDEKVALLVSAQRTSAKTGGDRREEGFEVKTRRIPLGFLPFPSVAKSNTVLIERRKPRRSSDD